MSTTKIDVWQQGFRDGQSNCDPVVLETPEIRRVYYAGYRRGVAQQEQMSHAELDYGLKNALSVSAAPASSPPILTEEAAERFRLGREWGLIPPATTEVEFAAWDQRQLLGNTRRCARQWIVALERRINNEQSPERLNAFLRFVSQWSKESGD